MSTKGRKDTCPGYSSCPLRPHDHSHPSFALPFENMRQRNLSVKGNTIATPTRHSINSREDHPISNSNATPWVDMVSPSWSSFVQLSRLDMLAGSLLIFWPCSKSDLSCAWSPCVIHLLTCMFFIFRESMGNLCFRLSPTS